jgi:Zn-dependent protease
MTQQVRVKMATEPVSQLKADMVGRAQGITIRRITLFVFGGMAHLEHEPHHWRAELWMAIAGPLASFAIGVACLVLSGVMLGPVEIPPPTRSRRSRGSTRSPRSSPGSGR